MKNEPSLLRSTKGSAIVEMLVAFPVFFGFFSSLVQLFYLEVGSLTAQHAVSAAARAAAVVAADDPKYYGSQPGSLDGSRKTEVEEAAKQALRLSSTQPKFQLTFNGGFSEGQTFKAHLEYDYPCSVPVGGSLVCGLSRKIKIVREASGASQTPGYTYP